MRIENGATVYPICGYGLEIDEAVAADLGFETFGWDEDAQDDFLEFFQEHYPKCSLTLLGEEGELKIPTVLIKAKTLKDASKRAKKLLKYLNLEEHYSLYDFELICDLVFSEEA